MDGNGMYLSVFYCLCFIKDMIMGVLEEQSMAKRDSDLDIKKGIRLCDYR